MTIERGENSTSPYRRADKSRVKYDKHTGKYEHINAQSVYKSALRYYHQSVVVSAFYEIVKMAASHIAHDGIVFNSTLCPYVEQAASNLKQGFFCDRIVLHICGLVDSPEETRAFKTYDRPHEPTAVADDSEVKFFRIYGAYNVRRKYSKKRYSYRCKFFTCRNAEKIVKQQTRKCDDENGSEGYIQPKPPIIVPRGYMSGYQHF